jgi:hypothetical protein
MVDEFQ